MAEFVYDAYISFAAADGAFAAALARELRVREFRVFTTLDLLAGEDFQAPIRDALQASRFVIVVNSTSRETLEFGYALFELNVALNRERDEKRIVIIPVRIDKSSLPQAIRHKVAVDFGGATSGDAFDAAVNRLVDSIHALQKTAAPETPAPAITTPRLPSVHVPADLALKCQLDECVLFAGAGLSARAGVPTWHQLLENLIEYALSHKTIDASYADALRGAMREGGRNEAADGLVQTFESNRGLLKEFLDQQNPTDVELSAAHRWLQQIPFASVITTNYDRLLETALPEYEQSGLYTAREADQLLDALTQKRRFILKLYGTVDRVDTLIFAPFEYRQTIASNILFARFMEGIFFSRTFLFLGLSLEGIQDFLSGFTFRGISPQKHFALVGVSGATWRVKAELLQRRYNIEVIPFIESPGYPEVDEFLGELSYAVRPVAVQAPTPTPSLPGIRRVVLEDIGPFERLELDFEKGYNWKVLLGDNGVGKSTILRAIAVAIIGNDARALAARLVRTGRSKGRIILYTEQNPVSGYVTEILTKDMLSEAEVVSLPSRPLEAEGWLALGFSALRVVTWASAAGPQAIIEKGRPTSEDLLPLISGESDSRMDRLKQWIVNLDASDKGKPRTLAGHQGRVSTVLFGSDERTLISGSIDGTIRFWDLSRNTVIRSIEAHAGGVNSIALSRDGKVLASGSFDRAAKTWNVATGESIARFIGSKSQILSVALDEVAQTLITVSESGTVRIWSGGGSLQTHFTPAGQLWCVALSPDGKTIALGSYDGRILLIDPQTTDTLAELKGGRGVIMGLAWSPDSETLASASRNGPVTVWDVRKLRRVHQLPGSDTMAVAVSADGRTIAGGFGSGQVSLWDSDSGEELMKIQAHSQAVRSVAFSPDGKTLASASADQTIKLWTITDSISGGNQQETIRRFFRLIASLTDRQDLDFLNVTNDYRVMVKTIDAVEGVPLESLSQGMTSLFGWVGVVCQRLKETQQGSTEDPLPVESYALVLIDELDAHMHPRWQQVLVSRLKTVFPNIQFIASTHSPLIIGGLDRKEVECFTIRDGKVVKVDFAPDMTLGRTDQILSGELFRLPGTLDPTTKKLIAEYESLLGKSNPGDAEKERLNALARLLEERIPPAPEGMVERRARELLEALQAGDEQSAPPRVQDRMAQLAKALSARPA